MSYENTKGSSDHKQNNMLVRGLSKTKNTEETWQKKVNAFFTRQFEDQQVEVKPPPIRCDCSIGQDKYDEQKKTGLNPDEPELCPSCKQYVMNFGSMVYQQKRK